jgi:hypothetical protein
MTSEQKALAKSEAGRLIVEGINESLDQSRSPVEGGYFERNKADGERSILFEEGDLRASIISKNKRGSEIEVGVFDPDEIPIAYNHNKGDTLPRRQFIPGERQSFEESIMNRVNQRLDEIRDDRETELEDERTTTIGDLFKAFEQSTTESRTGLFNFPTIGDLTRALGGDDGEL